MRGTSLGAPSLAAPQPAANETLDSSALSFLLHCAMEEKETEEEEERKKKEEEQAKRHEDQEEAPLTRLQAERDALLALGLEALSSQQKERLNAVLDEREAILDRRDRRRVVARRKRKRTRRSRCTWQSGLISSSPWSWQSLVRCPAVLGATVVWYMRQSSVA